MIYLNNAATSFPKPPGVSEALCRALESPPFSGVRGNSGEDDNISECREWLGSLFNADAERFFFTSGATEAFNMIVRGLDLRHVVVTAADHNAVLRPLYALLTEKSISVVPCRADGLVSPGALEKAVTPDTDALFINHCSNVTGAVQDLAKAAKIARKARALLIVDAAQSAGVIPIDVNSLGIDILVFTGHKGLLGPAGIGGFYLREGIEIAATKFGGTGTEGDLVKPVSKEMFEVGTPNTPGIAGLSAALGYVLETGVDVLGRRVDVLAERIASALSHMSGISVYAPDSGPRGGAVGFTLKGFLPADLGYILRHSYDIEVRAGYQCAPLYMDCAGLPGGLVRVSVSALTPEKDVDAFISAMMEISGVAEK